MRFKEIIGEFLEKAMGHLAWVAVAYRAMDLRKIKFERTESVPPMKLGNGATSSGLIWR